MNQKSMKKREWYNYLWNLLNHKDAVQTAVILTEPFVGVRVLWEDGGIVGTAETMEPFCSLFSEQEKWVPGLQTMEWEGKKTEIFVEVLSKQPRLVILGGGHISLPLCSMGKMLGFSVTVMDDRSEFANSLRFSNADQVICDSFSQCGAHISDLPNTYYVIVTRGHIGDFVCAEQILRRNCAYVGMIGSRMKVEKTKERLLEAGISESRLEELYAPIGLKIGGQTPAEIAVSIMAQIIQVKNSHAYHELDGQIGSFLEKDEKSQAVMAEIIEKKGSAPRGVGSRMLLCSDGRNIGSVGGGNAEYAVMETAKTIKQPQVLEFQMDGRESAGLGMICGGMIRVLMEGLE